LPCRTNHTSPLFTEAEKLVLDYSVAMIRTPVDVSEELFARLREHFDDAQIVELTHVIAGENMAGCARYPWGLRLRRSPVWACPLVA